MYLLRKKKYKAYAALYFQYVLKATEILGDDRLCAAYRAGMYSLKDLGSGMNAIVFEYEDKNGKLQPPLHWFTFPDLHDILGVDTNSTPDFNVQQGLFLLQQFSIICYSPNIYFQMK